MAATSRHPRLPAALLATALPLTAATLLATGCTTTTNQQPTTRPATWNEQAKNDPFHYEPSATDEWPSVSGGGISHFDKKAFNKDLSDVLNP